MPCQLCKSPLHTLARCDTHIDELWAPIRKIIQDKPFALREQYELISSYTVPTLKIMNRRLNIIILRDINKTELIYNIIIYFFRGKIPSNRNSNSANIADVSEVVEAYASLLMWRTTSGKKIQFRQSAYSWLDMYYRNKFCPEYIQLWQTNINAPDWNHRSLVLTQQAREELRAIGTLRAIELGMVPQRDPAKAHLKKLKIKVTIDKHLEFKECFMCYDLKPNLKLDCHHEYCADCLVGTAKVRTKTFLNCAVCRSEIKEVNVLTKELKAELMGQLKNE
jgi:hypothetical protein